MLNCSDGGENDQLSLPDKAITALTERNNDTYANTHQLLQIITYLECESSSSAVRSLKPYLWATMPSERVFP